MTSSQSDPSVGLCSRCRFARVTRSARGSSFWRCGKADEDPAFARYPSLPVVRCGGFVAAEAPPTEGG
ncbi:MAG: hypothetical protein MJE66_01895 [Proteobacteria bacterium]|nr:hypothetical protein [Pseudomonadota bacterium]